MPLDPPILSDNSKTAALTNGGSHGLWAPRMRFTVLGASGFIGSHLAAYIRSLGLECFTPLRGDPIVLERELGYVMYCAGLTADYSQRPFDTAQAHVCHLANILENAKFDGLLYLSSTRLYDSGSASTREEADLMLNPMNPRHLYDLSKAMGESLCLTAGKGRARIARLSCVYGDSVERAGFLSDLLVQALTHKEVRIDTALNRERDYIYIHDLVRLLVDIVTKGRRPLYNVASGVNVSNRELFRVLERCAGCRIIAEQKDDRTITPVIDVTRIKQEFSFSPSSVIDRLPELVASHRHSLSGVS